MTKALNKRIIVVLGMHRSGTSAVARSLPVFQVALGNTLMPSAAGNNPTGFWEDLEINALNNEMLRAIEDDWHHLSPIKSHQIAALRKAGFFNRAVGLLKKKVGNAPIFGFKDPRTARLLPFWKPVFTRCKCSVAYVLSIRHPLSVVRSLANRDRFGPEKSYMLWLAHVLESLTGTNQCQRVLVDYDRLIENPDREVNRMASELGLQIDPTELVNYKTEFLNTSLRHTVFGQIDLENDPSCPPLVRDIYPELIEVASDRIALDGKRFQKNLTKWGHEFARDEGFLDLADKLDVENTSLTQSIAHRDAELQDLNKRLTFLSDRPLGSPCLATIYLGHESNPDLFDEQNQVSQFCDLSGEFVTLEFELQAREEPFSRLRFDPSNCPCVLELQSIDLCTSAGEIFWTAETPANCFRNFNEQVLVILSRDLLAWMMSFGNDPNVELVLPQAALEQLSNEGGRLRLRLRGRSTDNTAIFASNDFRVLLRNEVDPPQWASKLTASLSAKLEEKSGNLEQLETLQRDGTAREQRLHTDILALAKETKSLQATLVEERTRTLAERTRLQDELEFIKLRSAESAAQLAASRVHETELQAMGAARERELKAQLQSSHQAALALTQSLKAQLQDSQQEALRLAKNLVARDKDLATQLIAAQTSATDLQAKFADRERAFSAQLQSSHQAGLMRTQSLTAQLQDSQQEALRLAKNLVAREQELATQSIAAQTSATDLEAKFAAREREFNAQLRSSHETALTLTRSFAEQVQAGQSEALHLAKHIAAREQELAAQLLATQTCLGELQLAMKVLEREVESESRDMKKESVQLAKTLREKETELFSKAAELIALRSNALWKALTPLRWILRIKP